MRQHTGLHRRLSSAYSRPGPSGGLREPGGLRAPARAKQRHRPVSSPLMVWRSVAADVDTPPPGLRRRGLFRRPFRMRRRGLRLCDDTQHKGGVSGGDGVLRSAAAALPLQIGGELPGLRRRLARALQVERRHLDAGPHEGLHLASRRHCDRGVQPVDAGDLGPAAEGGAAHASYAHVRREEEDAGPCRSAPHSPHSSAPIALGCVRADAPCSAAAARIQSKPHAGPMGDWMYFWSCGASMSPTHQPHTHNTHLRVRPLLERTRRF